jgi:PAS domain S-box-containing protein
MTSESDSRENSSAGPLRPQWDILRYPQKGWFEVGHTRMIFFDIFQGFYNLRKVIREEVGENASYLIFQAGIKGGFSFLEPMIRKGRIRAAPRGFVHGLAVFTDGGAGDFSIQEMDWGAGWARIACRNTFEGWMYAHHGDRPGKPSCDYTRGIILGFMQATHQYAGTGVEGELDCVETTCLATGDERCEFLIGPRPVLLEQGLAPSTPGKSIQEQLKELVGEKTREIQEVNRFNQRILENAPVGILTLNSHGVITSANPAVADITGTTIEDMTGRPLEEVTGRFSGSVAEPMAAGLRGKPFDLVDRPYLGVDGARRFLSIKGLPLRNEGGNPEGLLCIMEDTTDKTLYARRIEYLKNYNENIIESMTEGIMVLDSELRIQTWNRQMEQMFGTAAPRVLGENLESVVALLHYPRILDRLQHTVRSGEPFEEHSLQVQTRANELVVLNIKAIPLFDGDGTGSGIIVIHEDITEREGIEIRYRNLFETAQDGICLTDLKGRVISANRKVLSLLETDWDQLKGRSLVGLVAAKHREDLKEQVLLVREGKEIEPYEIELVGTTGRVTPVELSMSVVREGDRVFGLHIISRDITARKRMEEQMIRAGKLAAVGELASGVAHEINNPLASVAGYAEELVDLIQESGGGLDEDREEYVDYLTTIMEQAHRCKEITQNLLNFARQGEFQIVPTCVNSLLEKAILLLEPDARRSKVKIDPYLDWTLPSVATDPSQLQQVFLNVLKNALDASGAGTQVQVETTSVDGRVQVLFRDQGGGIPETQLKRIFNPFFTTKPPGKGTGLGLSICHRIMSKLLGSIHLECSSARGSTFVVELPVTHPAFGDDRNEA